MITLSFVDAAVPNQEIPGSVYVTVVPQVGDSVHYHVDFPEHVPGRIETGSVIDVKGTVVSRSVSYRYMAGWGSTPKTHDYVEVTLADCVVMYHGADGWKE